MTIREDTVNRQNGLAVPDEMLTSQKHNPVRLLQARLDEAFKRDETRNAVISENCLAVLERFLKLTGWAQGPRRIFEAMPHADDVSSVPAFRSMLYRLGFTTTVEQATLDNLRPEYLPCFLRYADGSVVLAEQRDRDGEVIIFDPASKGRSRARPDDINALAIFPEKIEKPDSQQNPAASSWTEGLLKAFTPHIRQIFLISFAVNILALAPAIFVMAVYDKAIAAHSYDVLAGLAVGAAIVITADYMLRRIRVELQAYLGARLDEQINETAFGRLLFLSLSHTEDAPIGSQLTRLRQMTSLHEAFTGPLASAIFDLPYIVLFIAVIALIGGPLVWAPISLIAFYGLAACWAVPKTGELIRKSGETRAQLNNLTVEAVSCQKAINDLAAEHVWLRRHRKLSAEAAIANMKARQIHSLLQIFSQSMVVLAGVGVLAFGVNMVIEGDLSGGALIAVMALSWRVLGPIRNLFLTGLTLGQVLQSFQQINRLARLPLESESNTGSSIPRSFKGHIVVDKVSFRHPGQREPTLRGVSLDARPGELVCIYGRSGAGASTMLRVLLGLHQQQAGSIYIDGLDLRQLDKGEWRQAVGVGLQWVDLFHGTVAQNIRLARPDASDEDLESIAQKLGIDQYYGNALELGLETRCTTMARSAWPEPLLTRINLARAFIKDAPIYILDEPAVMLDHTGEKALLSIIQEKRSVSTIIMKTQRPSHMRIADKVVWLDRGMVRDFGTPEQIVPKVLAA
ncbi:peptidase domain-containing ABC transporter [Hyphococcus sp.]|jgi:ABC-type bacteriocin/lantibiotic exporter with double-glycine peptidase domain|uniref:peptidase domain-containing ABC transporter n=1 Tax=Hyphococcus sp. TaxID=2038636 RepID=UPI003D0FF0C0